MTCKNPHTIPTPQKENSVESALGGNENVCALFTIGKLFWKCLETKEGNGAILHFQLKHPNYSAILI